MLAHLRSAVVAAPAVAAAALFLLLLWPLVLVLPPLSLPLVLPPLLELRPLCMRSHLFPAISLCLLGCAGSRPFVCFVRGPRSPATLVCPRPAVRLCPPVCAGSHLLVCSFVLVPITW